MADRIYISSRYSRNHVAWLITKLSSEGFDTSGTCVWDSVGDFGHRLKSGDRVVVYSFSTFDGSAELLGSLRLFLSRRATVHSLREPELSSQLTLPLVDALFCVAVDGLLGLDAQSYLKVDPSRVGALSRMDRLISSGVSVSEASRLSNCTRNVYYYYKRCKGVAPIEQPTTQPIRRTHSSRNSYPSQVELPL